MVTIDQQRLTEVMARDLHHGDHASPDEGMCVMDRAVAKLRAHTARDNSGCWIWYGYTQSNGYGWVNVAGLQIAAHRLALMSIGVLVPRGSDVCHRCDVRNCVNPAHLYVGSRQQNMADCTARDRHNKPRGERHWRARLSDADVRALRSKHRRGASVTELAAEYEVHHATVSRIVRGVWRKEVV